ncbi:hypothetical protein K435DRAFT_335971 [Dendrothele bispora CBS 962.96]|uniref:Uncharacterized protein n=1 Tax=Dendrothele bispora (strain CBS 962.96) TaxID=1314807 RepID=A0A4S8LFG4_DENBC|nr:hypothetical protein K435DRAFT_335971 [Dendrothele bispora CBS 962.96]
MDFIVTKQTLKMNGLKEKCRGEYLRLVTAILHLDNVSIIQKRDVALIPDSDEAFNYAVLGPAPRDIILFPSIIRRRSQVFKMRFLNRQISILPRTQSKSGIAVEETFVKSSE